MSAYHQNASCDPFVPQSSLCQQGNYVSYAINVREIDDVVAGIRFARENNVRLVIKNTGHEYVVSIKPTTNQLIHFKLSWEVHGQRRLKLMDT